MPHEKITTMPTVTPDPIESPPYLGNATATMQALLRHLEDSGGAAALHDARSSFRSKDKPFPNIYVDGLFTAQKRAELAAGKSASSSEAAPAHEPAHEWWKKWRQ